MPVVGRDWKAFAQTVGAYSAAAQDITSILDSFSTTSATISAQARELNDALLSAVGFAQSGVTVLGASDPVADSARVDSDVTGLAATSARLATAWEATRPRPQFFRSRAAVGR